ncbi:MAG: hypothetical protein E7573_07130 [Ruminococcaceae bacterium]|nr:hypothetical protein [Oscillospiraceae bacterium]MBR3597367.1 phosphotransferase [Clostridia bacterium]
MKILDISDKHLLPVFPKIVFEKLNKKADKIKFIGGGSFGRVYKAVLSDGKTIAIKAYRVQGSQHEEAQQLNILSENTTVKMPEVLFTYEDAETAVLAMTFVEGQNVLNPIFLLKSKSRKQKFANDVVSGMLQWHSITNEKFGSLSNPSYDSWYEYYKKEKQEPWLTALKDLSENGKFSKKKLQLLSEATELFNKLPEEKMKAVLIHSDLNIMNIMADSKTLKLTAFIDPCTCMWADREYDLFQLRNMWGDAYGLYEVYKQKYKLSEYADFRVAYYGAMNEASCRLGGGLIMPLWEVLCNNRLKKEMKKLKEKM